MAMKAGLKPPAYSQILAMPQMVPEPGTPYKHVDTKLAKPWRLDAKGNDWFIRMDVAALPDGHTMLPTTINGPASFWEVME
jgi:hypothetical protein